MSSSPLMGATYGYAYNIGALRMSDACCTASGSRWQPANPYGFRMSGGAGGLTPRALHGGSLQARKAGRGARPEGH